MDSDPRSRTTRLSLSASALPALVAVLLLAHGTHVEAKKYMRCELSRELLQKYQFSKTFLSNWICLIEHESNMDTRKLTKLANGSSNYGLFQINSKQCRTGPKVGSCDEAQFPCCNFRCEGFLDDDIADDVECAKRIFDRKGFQHWHGWSAFCRNPQNLPNLSVACNLNGVLPPSRPVTTGVFAHYD